MTSRGRDVQHRVTVLPEAELRYQPGVRVLLLPGHELWEDKSAHLLRGRLSAAVRRGEVEVTSDWRESKAGAAAVVVRRMRQPASRVPWYVIGVTAFMGAAVGVGVLLWESRYVILCGLAIAAVAAWVVSHALKGGGSGCACVLHGHNH